MIREPGKWNEFHESWWMKGTDQDDYLLHRYLATWGIHEVPKTDEENLLASSFRRRWCYETAGNALGAMHLWVPSRDTRPFGFTREV